MDSTDKCVARLSLRSILLLDEPEQEKKESSNYTESNSILALPESDRRQLSLSDRKDLKRVAKYADDSKDHINSTANAFGKKGFWGLFWDSKVPEKDLSFYNFINLRPSNRDKVLGEIKKYRYFYEEIGEVVKEVKICGEAGDVDKANLLLVVADVNQKLSEMYQSAETEQDFTSSSTLFRLHKSFITKHEKAEHMIKKLECVATRIECNDLKRELKNSKADLELSIERMSKASGTMNEMNEMLQNMQLENDDLRRNYAALKERSQILDDRSELLMEKMEDVKKMEQQNAILMEENKRMQEKQDAVMEDNKKMQEKQDAMMKYMEQIFKQQEMLLKRTPPPADDK